MSNSPFYIFAGGGTGGHLYPGLAVAEELMRLQPSARIVFACSDRAIDRRILDPLPYAVVPQPVRPIPRGPRGWLGFARAWLASAAQSRQLIADLQPASVLGLGGFAAGPVVRRAAKAGIRAAMLNPDAVPGKANQYLSRYVRVIFTQFPATAGCFAQQARGKVQSVGCPIRRFLLSASREEAMRYFGLRIDRRTLLVFGASLGASTINDAVAAIAADLDATADQWQALIISGAGKGADVAAAFKERRIHNRVLEYCDRMDLAYAAADLAVCRGGASTIAELADTGTPAVILPYPYHRDQQQRLNSEELQQAGAAVILDDRKQTQANAAALREHLLPLLADPPKVQSMRLAAKGLAKPNAAADVARWLVG